MALTLPHVLVVAGSDSSGGAGIARDIETIAAFGLRACLAVTAVTVQTHAAVMKVEPCGAELIEAQMRAALEANRIGAIKIGMLGAAGAVAAVARVLSDHADLPVVLDPVIAASSGKALLADAAIGSLRRDLMPRCALVTPNLPELALLTGCAPARDEAEIGAQAHGLMESGAPALLVKGGHGQGAHAVDFLFRQGRPPVRFEGPRLPGTMRGTGCLLASAIAAGLAGGNDLEAGIAAAKTCLAARWEGSKESPTP